MRYNLNKTRWNGRKVRGAERLSRSRHRGTGPQGGRINRRCPTFLDEADRPSERAYRARNSEFAAWRGRSGSARTRLTEGVRAGHDVYRTGHWRSWSERGRATGRMVSSSAVSRRRSCSSSNLLKQQQLLRPSIPLYRTFDPNDLGDGNHYSWLWTPKSFQRRATRPCEG